jgi:hypothetical protein
MTPVNPLLYDSYGTSKRYLKILSKWVPESGVLWLHKDLYRRIKKGEMCKIFHRSTKKRTLYAIVGR